MADIEYAPLGVLIGVLPGAYTNVFVSNDQVATLIHDPRTRGVA
jgi:hypothetical protein